MLKKIKAYQSRQTISTHEYSRILSAAVISNNFRKMLLSDPAKAISNGYSGEKFNLATDEKSRLSTIRATSLPEFAAQLAQI